MLINNSFKINNLQTSSFTMVKTANLLQALVISIKTRQNPLFTAVSAA